MYELVRRFNYKFGLATPLDKPVRFRGADASVKTLHMAEELNEYANAFLADDLEGCLDALIDLIYVALGAAVLHGFDRFDDAFRRVHEANMRKVRCTNPKDSKRGTTFDVIKPEGWKPASLKEFVS